MIVQRAFQRSFLSQWVLHSRQGVALQNDDNLCFEAMKSGKYLLFHEKGIRPLLNNNEICWKTFSNEFSSPAVFMTIDAGVPVFALSVSAESDSGSENFMDLRTSLFNVVDFKSASHLTRGWSILKWHQKTNFCANCGSESLVRNRAGTRLTCSNCSTVVYPTSASVGIVLVTNAQNDALLLVSLLRHPVGMFSCIAGYVDVGETLEECVRREVAEEAGVEVDSVDFSLSQHWPFPRSSLMLGCTAIASSSSTNTLSPLKGEVKDARWFTSDELRQAVVGKSESFFIPPKGTIARHMIAAWLASQEE